MGPRPEIRAVTGQVFSQKNLSGGDINDVVYLESEHGGFVLKTNNNPPPGLFASEAAGLALLRKNGLKVPEVYLTGEDFLLMQYFGPGAAQPMLAGEMLARLHSLTQPGYGLESPTYLATLLQQNEPRQKWRDFFIESRIKPLLPRSTTWDKDDSAKWEKFFERISPLLDSCPQASLLHGDLWSGNLYHADVGPVFIDPAVYCGDALVDVAMPKLFGGFGEPFYDAYFANTRRRAHVNELISIYQVYPLLVHARLFGAGYYRSATRIRDQFI